MKYFEILERFKREEEPEYIMPLTNDETLCDGLLGWHSMPVEYNADLECPEDILGNKKQEWDWLWENTRYDTERFGMIVKCRKFDIIALLMRLRSLYLIYPDGTINTLARQYMKSIVVGKIMKAQGNKKPAAKEKPSKDKNETD